ncbi:MFS-type transporter SLC18B1-like isoform X2 [Patiria miniata]|uniref:Major facilitator superfamily (MFS) profile domain-containing protein n=1 Tax=Patiria miniata TaxID=46514 RepID=A0A913ZKF9_PATMI|nr:MFS-type transporter SLC18B1-like isoform X2 [Patiria miniata]
MENKVEINASPSIEYVNSSGETPPNGAPPTSSLANKDRADEENDNIDKRSEEKPAGTKFTYHQKATFASAMMASLSNMMAASIISVFYPIEAKAKGMNQTVIGLVFSAFALTTGIGSPIWGKFIPVFGARFIFLAGAFVTGGCNVLFGFIVDMPTRATFTAFSFAIRLLEGLGSSATKTASAAIVAFTFPENVGTAVSLIEMTGGLAYAIGPAIGGLLYDLGFTVLQISFIFLSFGLSYAISSVIWGAVADAKKATRIMMVFGAFGSALFFLFLGPSQLLKIPSTKLLAILVIPTGTVMMGLFIMPTFVDMYISAEWYGVPTNLGVTSIIAGLWNGVFAFGSLVGPLLGGALTQVYGFAYATTIFAGALISVMIVLCLFGVWEYRCGKGRRVPRSRLEMQANTTDEEQVPLIPNDV